MKSVKNETRYKVLDHSDKICCTYISVLDDPTEDIEFGDIDKGSIEEIIFVMLGCGYFNMYSIQYLLSTDKMNLYNLCGDDPEYRHAKETIELFITEKEIKDYGINPISLQCGKYQHHITIYGEHDNAI